MHANNSIGQKQRKRIGQFALSSLWANIVQLLSTSWADSRVMPSFKVNCHP